jgi:predicted HicB family RNase H-like nuclease
MSKDSRGTIRVDADLHRRVKILSATSGKTIEQLTAIALNELLASGIQ